MSGIPTKVDSDTFGRALAIVHNATVVDLVEERMSAGRGRPRTFTYKTLFTLLALTTLRGGGQVLLTEVCRVQQMLNKRQRERLGLDQDIPYDVIQQAVTALDAGFRESVDEETGEVFPPRLGDLTLERFMSSIASGVIPANIRRSSTAAIDSTDVEGYPRRRSWGRAGKKKPSSASPLPEPDVQSGALPESVSEVGLSTTNEPGWPRISENGRLQHSIDPEAMEGYRAGKNRAPKGTFLGWDFHLCVPVPEEGEEAVPPLVFGASLAPAGSNKGESGLKAVDAYIHLHGPLSGILPDRGYTYLDMMSWALPLWERGIEQTIDLHPNQRGIHPGPRPGMIYVDGGLFSDMLPESLRKLPGFWIGMSAEEKADLSAKYDERIPYAFTRMGKPDPERGTQRYRHPVLAGKMRCPNHPKSMRLDPATHPTTTCEPGSPCDCHRTVVLGPTRNDFLNLRQRHLYGTKKWRGAYGRRNNVESFNALLHNHYANVGRGSFRVRGTNRTGVLAAFVLAAVNVTTLAVRYGYDVANPPSLDPTVVLLPLPQHRPTTALHREFSRPAETKGRSTDPPPDKVRLEPIFLPVLRAPSSPAA
ncbi:hypothetical protein M3C74_02300 [Micrococcus lylae]|uniref:hypothetical protein n=1 Tax=Micrococcus lylae TaxID=1273 RepID=UPI0021A595B8|nr:hypothetical protein [Micrococcus lylae]MCT2006855.1 hypothetical protein [Micrococcus lylae]MCT2070675.1 hypothetical protein [Micrococcus lylae]